MQDQVASPFRWTILLLATLVQVGVSILQQAPAALGPVLTRDLDLSRAQIGLLSSAIWGGMLLAMLPVGLLIDRHGQQEKCGQEAPDRHPRLPHSHGAAPT